MKIYEKRSLNSIKIQEGLEILPGILSYFKGKSEYFRQCSIIVYVMCGR